MLLLLAAGALLTSLNIRPYGGADDEEFTLELKAGWVNYWLWLDGDQAESVAITIKDSNGNVCFDEILGEERLMEYYAEKADREKDNSWWGDIIHWRKGFGEQLVSDGGSENSCRRGQALASIRPKGNGVTWRFEVEPV